MFVENRLRKLRLLRRHSPLSGHRLEVPEQKKTLGEQKTFD